jgi:hypothetical protein
VKRTGNGEKSAHHRPGQGDQQRMVAEEEKWGKSATAAAFLRGAGAHDLVCKKTTSTTDFTDNTDGEKM